MTVTVQSTFENPQARQMIHYRQTESRSTTQGCGLPLLPCNYAVASLERKARINSLRLNCKKSQSLGSPKPRIGFEKLQQSHRPHRLYQFHRSFGRTRPEAAQTRRQEAGLGESPAGIWAIVAGTIHLPLETDGMTRWCGIGPKSASTARHRWRSTPWPSWWPASGGGGAGGGCFAGRSISRRACRCRRCEKVDAGTDSRGNRRQRDRSASDRDHRDSGVRG